MTISVLQVNAENSNLATTSLTIVDTTTYTAGSGLEVFVLSNSGVTVVSLVSSNLETFVNKGQIVDSGGKQATRFVSTTPLVGGSTTLTATFDDLIDRRGIVTVEIGDTSGYDSAADANAENQQDTPTTATNAVTSTNMPALTTQPALIVGISHNSGGSGAPNVGTGFTSHGTRVTYGGAVSALCRVESKRVVVTTAAAATFTATDNSGHLTFASAWLENGAGGGASPKLSWQQQGAMGTMVAM